MVAKTQGQAGTQRGQSPLAAFKGHPVALAARKKKAPGKAVSQGGEGHSLFRERLDAPAPRWG